MTTQHTEKDFEKAIENRLTHAGYQIAPNTQFDTALALDKTTLTNFIKTTQKNVWQKLKDIHGTPEKILERPFTGQRAIHAIKQYLRDRKPTIHTPLLQRALIHFALNTDEVYATKQPTYGKTSGKKTVG
jgi:hypothetical protein